MAKSKIFLRVVQSHYVLCLDLLQYEKAKKEGKLIKNFGKEATEQRIANMDTIVQIAEAVKDGDFRFEAEDYNGALET